MVKSILFIGPKTELNFVDAFIKRYYKGCFSMPTRDSKAWEPKDIVEYANSQIEHHKLIFCFLDRDNFPDYKEAVELCEEGVVPIYSNPKFELWYLLSSKKQISHINNNELDMELSKVCPDYKKPRPPKFIYEEDYLSRSIKNSKDIIKSHERDKKDGVITTFDCETNPQTMVHRIFEILDAEK